jgi:hypothetical protein
MANPLPRSRPCLFTAFAIALLATCGSAQTNAVELDRMVAVVDRHVITQNEWQAQEQFLALLDGRQPGDIKLDQASLDRLMDRELILAQIENVNFARVTPQEVAEHIAEVRKQSGATEDKAWTAKLAEYGLDEEEFSTFTAQQMDVVRFIENRFRANARVTSEMVESYYKQKFIPELMKTGATSQSVPALKQVQDKITQILVEQRVDEMLGAWVESLRNQAHVRRVITFSTSDSAHQAGVARENTLESSDQ